MMDEFIFVIIESKHIYYSIGMTHKITSVLLRIIRLNTLIPDLLNWLYYSEQILPFSQVNYLSMNRKRKQAWRNKQKASTNTNEAIENIKTYFDSKFDDIQQQFSKENKKLAKRMKADSKYKFRYKSNQIRFDLNESISDKVDTIVKLIKNRLQKRASKLAKSIKEDIEKRNKLLKIADKLIAGWRTVEEYLSDDLASDSEDDRKIKAAERRALQKQNIRRTNQRSSETTTKPPPSKPVNNQFRNVQQGGTFREQNTSSATASTTQNDSRRISTGPP